MFRLDSASAPFVLAKVLLWCYHGMLKATTARAEFLCCGFNSIMFINHIEMTWTSVSGDATKCLLKLISEVLSVPSQISCQFGN